MRGNIIPNDYHHQYYYIDFMDIGGGDSIIIIRFLFICAEGNGSIIIRATGLEMPESEQPMVGRP